MSLLPTMTALVSTSSSSSAEKVATGNNKVTDSESFALALEVLKQLDQGKSEKNVPVSQEMPQDVMQQELEQSGVDADKKAKALDLSGRSKAELNIEAGIAKEIADMPLLNLFQISSGVRDDPETPSLVSNKDVGVAVAEGLEETEVGLEMKYLLNSGSHGEKVLEKQGSTANVREVNRVDAPQDHSGKRLFSEVGEGDHPLDPLAESLGFAQAIGSKTVEHSKTELSDEASVETLKIGRNENEGHTKAIDDFFVQSAGRAEIYDTGQESSPLQGSLPLMDDKIISSKGSGITVTNKSVPERTEIDFEGKNMLSHLPKSGPQFEEGLVEQLASVGLTESKKMNVPPVYAGETLSQRESAKDLPVNPVSEVSEVSEVLSASEVPTAKNPASSNIETSSEQSKVGTGKTGALQTEALEIPEVAEGPNIEAIKIAQNENRQNADSAGVSKTRDEILVKPPTEAGIYDTTQESLAADSQAGEFQEGQESLEGVQDRSLFHDDLLKVSSPAQSPNLEAEASVADRERPALGISEKTAVLSQLAEQFRALQPGKLEQLRLRLHPESLGALQVEITLQKGAVLAHIITSDHLVKDLLEGNRALLSQSLAEQGFEIDGFSVDVGDPEDGFKDRQTEPPFFENRRFNPKNNGSPLEEVGSVFNPGGAGRISLYV